MNEEINTEKKKSENAIQKFTHFLPLISGLVICLSILKSIIFFNHFNIPIKFYLTLSELPIIIAGDLFLILPLLIFGLLTANINVVFIEKKLIQRRLELLRKSGRTKVSKKYSPFWNRFIMITIFIGIVWIIILSICEKNYGEIYIGICCIGTLLIAFYFTLLYEFPWMPLPSLVPIFYSMHVLLCFGIFFAITTMEIQNVDNGRYTGTKIVTKDSTFKSTDSAFFIGQTSNYIFFYNKKDKHTSIIPASELKEIELFFKNIKIYMTIDF